MVVQISALFSSTFQVALSKVVAVLLVETVLPSLYARAFR